MRTSFGLAALVLLSACGKSAQPGPVQDASMTPLPSASASTVGFELQPITPDIADKNELGGAGCTFQAAGAKDEQWAVVTRDDNKAWFMTGGALVTLTADGKPAENEIALDRYDSDKYSLRITKASNTPADEEFTEIHATVAILDAAGKQLYQANGMLLCGG